MIVWKNNIRPWDNFISTFRKKRFLIIWIFSAVSYPFSLGDICGAGFCIFCGLYIIQKCYYFKVLGNVNFMDLYNWRFFWNLGIVWNSDRKFRSLLLSFVIRGFNPLVLKVSYRPQTKCVYKGSSFLAGCLHWFLKRWLRGSLKACMLLVDLIFGGKPLRVFGVIC